MTQRVGKYEVIERLSFGGMAELWLAVLPGPGGFRKVVALKQILPDAVREEQFVKMFLDEARLTASLSHPNIAQVYELGHEPDSGELYLAMEFVAGRTLYDVRERAAEQGSLLPTGFSCRVVRDALLGLHAAHTLVQPDGTSSPVVHRDLSPANVMVTFDGLVKVIDFGIAKAKNRLSRTRVGQVKGTVGYMSPEQLKDQDVDPRSDLFAAGVVLYELLSGRQLYGELTREQAAERFALFPIPALTDAAPHVPKHLADVVMKAVALDRSERWRTAKEFAHALEVAAPEFFDEEAVGRTVRELFPDAVALTRELLVAASQATPDEKTITRAVKALRRPNPMGPIPPAQVPTKPQRPTKARGQGLWVALGALVVVAAGSVAVLLATASDPGLNRLPSPDAMAQLEQQVMAQVQAALAMHDLTRARQLLDSCRIGDTPCPAAVEALKTLPAPAKPVAPPLPADPEPAPPPAKCDVEAARGLVRSLDWDAATQNLRTCTEKDGSLKRDARALLDKMKEAQTQRKRLWSAQQALEQGDVARARTLINQTEPMPILAPALNDLRMKVAKASGASGVQVISGSAPGGKEFAVSGGKATPPQLVSEARSLVSRKQYRAALTLMDECLRDWPQAYDCHKVAGSAYAKLGAMNSDQDMVKASVEHYRSFVELAPPGDPDVPKVRQILSQYEQASGH